MPKIDDSHVQEVWRDFSLARQFVLITSAALTACMFVLGTWVTGEIENGVTQNTASATALYMDSSVAPIVQELSQSDNLSPNSRKALGELLANTELGKRVLSFKIWGRDGLVIYSSLGDIVGKKFKPTDNLKSAWGGDVAAEFVTLNDEEDKFELALGVPLLEVYSPIYKWNSRRVIAVGEFYADATDLNDDLFAVRVQSWLLVVLLTLATITVQWGVVWRGSRTIERQGAVLKRRVADLSSLLRQNDELRNRAERATERTAEINEHFLRRVGADLHDGPAQLLGLALLRIDSLKPQFEQATESKHDIETVRGALSDALKEIRDLSAGFALPEIERLTVKKAFELAVRMHENRTGTAVQSDISQSPQDVRSSIKVCLYRFVQEGLNNAFKHAGGHGQRLQTIYDGSIFEVVVEDCGEGFSLSRDQVFAQGLGLSGLRERVVSLHGEFDVISRPGEGCRLTVRFPANTLEMRRDR
ncbi:signal transduction histidine-protein kinase/phosphatase DegS [bacterium MnTg02]|nr:signal transduction histidine-protein kinase/phosphatase DegS [bacterium MnTg02]